MPDAWCLVRRLAVGAGALVLAPPTGGQGLPDRWAPGALDPAWREIGKLQAYPGFASDPPDWQRALSHPSPLVRTAAAAAMGRAPDPGTLTRIETLLEDPSRVVQRTALWALLQRSSDDLEPALRTVVQTWPFLRDSGNDGSVGEPQSGFGRLFELVGLPEGLAKLSLIERRQWLAALVPGQWRIHPLPNERAQQSRLRVHLSAAESEIDADQVLRLRVSWQPVDPAPPPTLHGVPPRLPLDQSTWVQLLPDGRAAPMGVDPRLLPRLRGVDGAQFLEVGSPGSEDVLLALDTAIDPGLYAVSLAASNPVFVRLRRSAGVERAVPGLLKAAATDATAVERLGRLRVRAAAPPLAAEWRRSALSAQVWMRDDPEATAASERARATVLLRAMTRLEDPDAATAIAPYVLSADASGSTTVWLTDPWRPELGEPLRRLAEERLLAWRQRLAERRVWDLGAVVEWPGFEADSRFARELDTLAQELARVPVTVEGRDWALAGALRGLARFSPERAAQLLTEALRRRDAGPSLVNLLTAGGAARPSRAGEVCRRAWPGVRDDPGVNAEIKAALALAAARDGGTEWLEQAGPIPSTALAWWLGQAQLWPYPPPPDWPCRARLAREHLKRRPDASLELALADLLRSMGEAAEARELVLAALPRLAEPHRKAHAQVVLGLLHLVLGEAPSARRALQDAQQLPAVMQGYGGRAEIEAALANLDTRPEVPGLRLRYEYQPLGTPSARSGSARFWVDEAGRVLFVARQGAPSELLGLALGRVVSAQALDHEHLAVVLSDGSVALYAAGSSGPRWTVTGLGAAPRLAVSQEAVVVEGPDGIDILAARDGKSLRRHTGVHLACGAPLPPLVRLVDAAGPPPSADFVYGSSGACATGWRPRPGVVAAGAFSVAFSEGPHGGRGRHEVTRLGPNGAVAFRAVAPNDPRPQPRAGSGIGAAIVPGGVAIDLEGGLEEIWELVPGSGGQHGSAQPRP